MNKNLGNKVKEARKLKGLSQIQLAKLARVSQTTVSDIERGRNTDSKKLPPIAKALGMPVEELLGAKPSVSVQDSAFKRHFVVVHSFDELIKNKSGSKRMEYFGELDASSIFCNMESDVMEGTSGAYIPSRSTIRVVTDKYPTQGDVALYKMNDSLCIGHYTELAGIPHIRPSNSQYPIMGIKEAELIGVVSQVITNL